MLVPLQGGGTDGDASLKFIPLHGNAAANCSSWALRTLVPQPEIDAWLSGYVSDVVNELESETCRTLSSRRQQRELRAHILNDLLCVAWANADRYLDWDGDEADSREMRQIMVQHGYIPERPEDCVKAARFLCARHREDLPDEWVDAAGKVVKTPFD